MQYMYHEPHETNNVLLKHCASLIRIQSRWLWSQYQVRHQPCINIKVTRYPPYYPQSCSVHCFVFRTVPCTVPYGIVAIHIVDHIVDHIVCHIVRHMPQVTRPWYYRRLLLAPCSAMRNASPRVPVYKTRLSLRAFWAMMALRTRKSS